MMHGMTLWLLALLWMTRLVPAAPWRETFLSTAVSMAEVVETEDPLYQDDDSRVRTLATLIALARYESVFDPNAWGDKGKGDSRGLYQQQRFGDLRDVGEATHVALSQIRISFRICRYRPVEDRLGWYAAGGDGCGDEIGIKKSRNRMRLARQLAGEGQ
jgi:hypothetical protein